MVGGDDLDRVTQPVTLRATQGTEGPDVEAEQHYPSNVPLPDVLEVHQRRQLSVKRSDRTSTASMGRPRGWISGAWGYFQIGCTVSEAVRGMATSRQGMRRQRNKGIHRGRIGAV